MSIYIDYMGRKYAYDLKANYCVLFNAALSGAIDHHESNGWLMDAELFLNNLQYPKNRNYTALNNAVNLEILPGSLLDIGEDNEEDLFYMYKVV